MSFIFKISGASLSCRQVDPIQKHHSQAEGSTRTYSATCLVTDKSKEMNKKKKNVRFADTIKVASYANLTGGSITRHADESVAWSRKARLDDSGEEYVKLRSGWNKVDRYISELEGGALDEQNEELI